METQHRLWRYNGHTLERATLKCAVLWVLVYSQCNYHSNLTFNIFLTLKGHPIQGSIRQPTSIPIYAAPGNHNMLSVPVDLLLLTASHSGTLCHDRGRTRSVYPSSTDRPLSCFHCLALTSNAALNTRVQFSWECVLSFFLEGIPLGMQLMSPMVWICDW